MEIEISSSLSYTKLRRDNKRDLWSSSREVLGVTGIEMHFCSRSRLSQLFTLADAAEAQKTAGCLKYPSHVTTHTRDPDTEARENTQTLQDTLKHRRGFTLRRFALINHFKLQPQTH